MKETLCECFGMCPSFVAGILNRAKRIHFFVLGIEKLNYEYYIEKCIVDKDCSFSYNSEIGHSFQISYHGEAFQATIFPKVPS